MMLILTLFLCSAIRTAIAVIKTACLFLNENLSVFLGTFINYIKNSPFHKFAHQLDLCVYLDLRND